MKVCGGLTRREFVRMAGGAAAFAAMGSPVLGRSGDKPNILWITSEDNGPHLGCYGDKFADTPSIDSIAAKGSKRNTHASF